MEQIAYRDWIFECDVEATRQAYRGIEFDGAEECGCSTCRNFVRIRQEVYPTEVLDLFARLGVDGRKEAEAYHNGRVESGLHHYGAWLHFVGRIVKQPNAPADLGKHFSIDFLTQNALAAKSFANQPLVQVEVTMEVPWLLKEEPEPE